MQACTNKEQLQRLCQIPGNRCIAVCGPPSSGKTTAVLQAVQCSETFVTRGRKRQRDVTSAPAVSIVPVNPPLTVYLTGLSLQTAEVSAVRQLFLILLEREVERETRQAPSFRCASPTAPTLAELQGAISAAVLVCRRLHIVVDDADLFQEEAMRDVTMWRHLPGSPQQLFLWVVFQGTLLLSQLETSTVVHFESPLTSARHRWLGCTDESATEQQFFTTCASHFASKNPICATVTAANFRTVVGRTEQAVTTFLTNSCEPKRAMHEANAMTFGKMWQAATKKASEGIADDPETEIENLSCSAKILLVALHICGTVSPAKVDAMLYGGQAKRTRPRAVPAMQVQFQVVLPRLQALYTALAEMVQLGGEPSVLSVAGNPAQSTLSAETAVHYLPQFESLGFISKVQNNRSSYYCQSSVKLAEAAAKSVGLDLTQLVPA